MSHPRTPKTTALQDFCFIRESQSDLQTENQILLRGNAMKNFSIEWRIHDNGKGTILADGLRYNQRRTVKITCSQPIIGNNNPK